MRTYQCFFLGGGHVTASDSKEFVEKMKIISRSGELDSIKYMEQVADRCYTYSESVVRTDTTDNFMTDLISEKFVVVVETH